MQESTACRKRKAFLLFLQKADTDFPATAHPPQLLPQWDSSISLVWKVCGKVPEGQAYWPRADLGEGRPRALAHALTHHGGLLQKLEAGFKCHLLQRGGVGPDPKAIQRLVHALEAHIVGDQGEMAGIDLNACHIGNNIRKDYTMTRGQLRQRHLTQART